MPRSLAALLSCSIPCTYLLCSGVIWRNKHASHRLFHRSVAISEFLLLNGCTACSHRIAERSCWDSFLMSYLSPPQNMIQIYKSWPLSQCPLDKLVTEQSSVLKRFPLSLQAFLEGYHINASAGSLCSSLLLVLLPISASWQQKSQHHSLWLPFLFWDIALCASLTQSAFLCAA